MDEGDEVPLPLDNSLNVNSVTTENIGSFLDKNCKSADDAKHLIDLFKARLNSLEKFNQTDAGGSSGAVGKEDELGALKSVKDDAQTSLLKLRELLDKRQDLMRKIEVHKRNTETLFDNLKDKTDNLKKLQTQKREILTLKEFSLILHKMESCFKESTPKAIMHYSEAVALYNKLPDDSNPELLDKMFAKIDSWQSLLIDSVKAEFLRVMARLGWGSDLTSSSSNQNASVPAEKEALIGQRNELFLQLLGLQKPAKRVNLNDSVEISGPVEDVEDAQILPPIEALLIVFKKRFYFHFCGDRKTNNVEKPEWYLTQILKWVQQSVQYLDTEFQPLVDKVWKEKPVSVKIMFADGIMKFVKTKMTGDFGQIIYNDVLLSHYVDEVLSFDKEFEDTINVENVDSCFFAPLQSLLLDDKVFVKWLEMESNLVKEKLDSLLSDWDHCWKPEVAEEQSLKFIPKCANVFLTLLECITNRYRRLPSFSHKRKFYLLQLELLDEFRTRLMQLRNQEKMMPVSESFVGIVNSASYVHRVLTQWSSDVSYALLVFPSNEPSLFSESSSMDTDEPRPDTGSSGPFDYQIESMMLFIQDCELIMARHVASLIKEKLTVYGSQKIWSKSLPKQSKSNQGPSDQPPQTVSGIAADILMPFASEMEHIGASVSPDSFRNIWQLVCKFVDNMLYVELVLKTTFSELGSRQLVLDMSQGLFPIFGQYTNTPRNFFPFMGDVMTLFTLSKGSLILLKEHLEQMEKGMCEADEIDSLVNEHKLMGLTNTSQILKVLSKLIF